MSDLRLVGAIAVNGLLTIGQIIGGIISGSLSLVADALHNLNDAASLGLALVVRRIARKPADRQRTFGYGRAEVIGALINLTALILIGVFLVYKAIERFFSPEPIDGWIVVIVGGIALVVDVVTAALTYTMSKHSINIKAAFTHNVADALGSVAVIIVGTLILLYEWYFTDLLAAILIAAYILHQGFTQMGESIRILMQSVPREIDLDEVVEAMESLADIDDVHHVHIWQIDEHQWTLEAHVVIGETNASAMERIKSEIKNLLDERFHIHHSTLEFETPSAADHDHNRIAAH